MGYVHGTKAALEVMRPKDSGAIVQVGSALSYSAIPMQAAYCACKFAIRGFTDSLRAEFAHSRSKIKLTMLQMPGMNTIQFDWARNKLAYKYQPVGDVFDPAVAADAVMQAIKSGPRELWVGGSAIESIVGQLVSPALMDRYIANAAWAPQMSDTPEDADRADNLYEPVPGDQGARGRFSRKSKPKALILNPERTRAAAAIAGLLVASLGLLSLGRSRA